MSDGPTPACCETCQHYRIGEDGQGDERLVCCGTPGEFAGASADDDSNMSTWFQPPPDFFCTYYNAKAPT